MKINNDNIELQLNNNAEITSIKYLDKEVIYQANEGWKKQFPIIFPSLGVSKGFKYKDKTFEMPKHGFWKDLKWESFFENEELLSVATITDKDKFPFMLDIVQRIGIDNNTLYINYEITNLDKEEALFQFGIHPAFIIDNNSFVKTEDSFNLMSLEGQLSKDQLKPGGKLINSLPFGEDFDTLVSLNTENKKIELHTTDLQLEMQFDSPHIQLWKPSQDNFLCIEPWYGHNDAWYDAPENIKDKKEIIKLESRRTWSATVELSFKQNKKA